jgi:NTP pyrophosphatase (non-canonical NTP hydrolase)
MKKEQQEVDTWVREQFQTPYWHPFENLARLIEEVGELAREINQRYGVKKKKPTEELREVEDELGDILFTLICIANSLNIDLDQSFARAMEKCRTRDANRFEKKQP